MGALFASEPVPAMLGELAVLEEAWNWWMVLISSYQIYSRGISNFQYYGSIFLIQLWSMVPQMDFKMILVII